MEERNGFVFRRSDGRVFDIFSRRRPHCKIIPPTKISEDSLFHFFFRIFPFLIIFFLHKRMLHGIIKLAEWFSPFWRISARTSKGAYDENIFRSSQVISHFRLYFLSAFTHFCAHLSLGFLCALFYPNGTKTTYNKIKGGFTWKPNDCFRFCSPS